MEADSSRWGRWKPPAEGGKEISHMRVENEDLFLFPQCRRCQGPTDMGGDAASAPGRFHGRRNVNQTLRCLECRKWIQKETALSPGEMWVRIMYTIV